MLSWFAWFDFLCGIKNGKGQLERNLNNLRGPLEMKTLSVEFGLDVESAIMICVGVVCDLICVGADFVFLVCNQDVAFDPCLCFDWLGSVVSAFSNTLFLPCFLACSVPSVGFGAITGVLGPGLELAGKR